MWKQDHLTTLTYHNKYIFPMLFKIFHSFADSPSHAVPQALAVASELAISLRRWSNIDNWHAECGDRKISTRGSIRSTRLAEFPTGTMDPRVEIFRSPQNTTDGFFFLHTPIRPKFILPVK